MTDDTALTPLERAVADFLDGEYPTFAVGHPTERYVVVPARALARLRAAGASDPRPYVSIDPAMKGGRPTLNGTSLLVDTIVGAVWAGGTVDQIERLWEVSRHDILVCCWFMGIYGYRTWQKRWRAWAQEAAYRLSLGLHDEIDWPPTEATAKA